MDEAMNLGHIESQPIPCSPGKAIIAKQPTTAEIKPLLIPKTKKATSIGTAIISNQVIPGAKDGPQKMDSKVASQIKPISALRPPRIAPAAMRA